LCVVTGGSGFVGRALVRLLLDQGYRVRIFDRAGHAELDPRAELVLGDLRNAAEVRAAVVGAGSVFHTASLIHLAGVARRRVRRQVFAVNVTGTRHVIEACRAEGVPRLVYTSSNNVGLDRAADVTDGDERAPYARRFVDLYSETKSLAEREVLDAGKQAGLYTCALRPGGIWGPHAGGVMLDKVLERIARDGVLMRIGPGALADNTHVDNLCDAHLLAARALAQRPEQVSGQAYFITDGDPCDPFEWFMPLFEGLGVRPLSLRLPAKLMYGVGYACEWGERLGVAPALLTRIEVLKLTRKHSFRIDKARRELGYEPRVSTRAGLEACLPYARAYLARRRRELAGSERASKA
jgi:3beta-hydroxy-delta5-steroid dehydrogenase/steroid delta-isomerase